MSEKKTRLNLTTAEKVNILNRIKAGETRETLCKETGVGLITIERWIKNEKALRDEALTATNPSRSHEVFKLWRSCCPLSYPDPYTTSSLDPAPDFVIWRNPLYGGKSSGTFTRHYAI